MSKVGTTSLMTAASVLRSRLVGAALVFAVAIGVLTRLFAGMSLDQTSRLTADFVLTGVIGGGILLAIITTASLLLAEQDRGVMLIIRSKPVSSQQLIVGKYLGLLAALSLLYWVVGGLALVIAGWGVALPWAELGLTLLVGWMELALVIALGAFFAALSSPTLATLLTVGAWFSGRSLSLLLTAAERAGGAAQWFITFVSYLLPNFSRFNLHETYLTARQLSVSFYLNLGLYAIIWIVILLLLATVLFDQREW